MFERDFINQVIAGNLGENDIKRYALDLSSPEAMIDNLFLLAHGALLYGFTTGISDQVQIDRLNNAASWISEAVCQREPKPTTEPITAPATELHSASLHYPATSGVDMEKIFVGLQDAGYISKNATYAQWRCICGMNYSTEQAQIQWTGTKITLAYLIKRLWIDNRTNQRSFKSDQVTRACFVTAESKPVKSIANELTKLRNDDFKREQTWRSQMDAIINGTYQTKQK